MLIEMDMDQFLHHVAIKLRAVADLIMYHIPEGSMKKREHHSKAAMKHADKPGAGAKKRAHLKNPKTKVATVMEEFKRGTLHSGKSKAPVTNRKQAVAIGLSEARKAGAKIPKKKKR